MSRLPAKLIVSLITGAFLCCPSLSANDGVKDISDNRIEVAIEGELWGARSVNANGIDLSVADGVATLSGNVNNILAKESAVRIAQMTKGVRSVVDQIEVNAKARDDRELSQDVLRALAEDPATDSWEITVAADKGTVTLDGTVDSYAERELAGKVAKSTRGVRKLNNQIAIEFESDRSDYQIKKEIEQRLAWDARLDDELITVEVGNGEVDLSGSVGSDHEKSLARGDSWVAGVTAVSDESLKVTWWSRDEMQRRTSWKNLKDDDIRQAVKDAFLYDPRVMSFNPDVQVENGLVTLTGIVDNLKAKRAAAQDAKNTVGVWRVKNFLKIRPNAERPSEAVRRDVENAFARDLWVNRFDITTTVIDGEVHLYGDVDSYFEKEQAADVASTVNGVTDVHNHLEVSYDYPAYSYTRYYDWDPTLYDFDNDYDYSTTQSKSEREIRQEVESQLWWSPWVDEDEVDVMVDGGTVTLTGKVDSWNERDKAAENALEGGAVKVINELQIQ